VEVSHAGNPVVADPRAEVRRVAPAVAAVLAGMSRAGRAAVGAEVGVSIADLREAAVALAAVFRGNLALETRRAYRALVALVVQTVLEDSLLGDRLGAVT
jgi:hypothetical protein